MIRSSNPVLSTKNVARAEGGQQAMSIAGAVNKTSLLLAVLCVSAYYTWQSTMGMLAEVNAAMAAGAEASLQYPVWVVPAFFGTLIIAITLAFKKVWAPVLAPVYAVLQGMILGALSAVFEAMYPGIVVQAVMCTFGTLFALLLAYKTGLIRATDTFKRVVVTATLGIMLVYAVSLIMNLFGASVPFIHSNGPMGIAFSVFVTIIAALNLVLDFDFIERGQQEGLPKYMEWYGAFGLLVTLVWLYLEFLRLLAKLRSGD